jgi:hypothetical protein
MRDRVHDLANEVQKLQGSEAGRERDLRRLERVHGKALEDLELELQALAENVKKLAMADEIADAVASRIDVASRRSELRRFTRLQAWGVRAAIISAVVAGVGEIIRLVLSWAGYG